MSSDLSDPTSSCTRRRIIRVSGVGLGASLAGCVGLLDDDADQLRRDIGDLQAEIEELEQSVSQERDRVDHLESDLDAERNRTEQLSAEVAAERERLEQAQKDLENERQTVAELREEMADLERDVATTRSQFESWNVWGFSDTTLDRLQQLAHAWLDSVVVIDVITDDGRWAVGTGWMYTESIVATNAHVVRPGAVGEDSDVARYDVWTYDGTRETAELLGVTFGRDDVFDSREDIAFLRVPQHVGQHRVMNRGISRELETGAPLLQIGHPWSVDYWTPAAGPFVGHREPFFASNVPGQPGVSGSPVVDLEGDVVGMTWGGHYHQVPYRQPQEAPKPGADNVLMSFEEAIHGMHSYMYRIDEAFEFFE